MDRITLHYSKAYDLALLKLQKIARKILRRYKTLNEFIMGMGTWFFTHKKNDWNYDSNDIKYDFKELTDFLATWDRWFCLTGEPMRFTAKGEVITDW